MKNDPHLVNGLYRWLHCITELTQSEVTKQEVKLTTKEDETDNKEDETDNKEDERPFYKQTLQRTFII